MSLRQAFTSVLMALGVTATFAGTALADNDHRDGNGLQARPFVFVGKAGDCGPARGSNIVTSGWLGGMGLPDDGTSANSPNPGTARDPHFGLLLNKNGPTPDCSSAGATIEGFKPGSTITEIGFDYRIGGHCGAGAPRFNIVSTAGDFYFVGGCANVPTTPAPQDPAQWGRVRFTSAQFFGTPAFAFGVTKVRSIEIILDEGTDTPSVSDPTGVGLAVIDNIDINGKLITSGHGVVPRDDNRARDGRDDADED
jgi:hypothetical protein